MSKINFLTRWKIQLNSTDIKLRKVALTEIVEMFNKINEESQHDVYILLIHADICHFLSEVVTYRDRNLMSLANKVVCHLSETQEFFKRDFFKIFRGYLRVITSFPMVSDGSKKHQSDIFTCVNIFFKR